jgi:uncharacterized protein
VNTASAALLCRVSGLSATVAENIVRHRDDNGPFKRRKDLLKVARLGEKTFEQCAGFLRIADGDQPLDASAVHPEAYPVVERIVASTARPIKALIGDGSFLRGLKAEQFTDDTFGVPTVRDILKELEAGPRPAPGVQGGALRRGRRGHQGPARGHGAGRRGQQRGRLRAFVDIGVHQDGLIHISALSDTFVKDPRDVVKAGDIVKVKVLEVDVARKRIALTRRLDDTPGQATSRPGQRDERGQAKGRAVTLAARTVDRTAARALAAVRPSLRRRPTMPWPRPSPGPSAAEDRAPVTVDPGRGTCRFSP